MTKQEIIDTVARHLLTQKRQSKAIINGAPDCAYRGENGLMCAAGVLIPDDEYNADMEGKPVRQLKFFRDNFSREELDLIAMLQKLHDALPVVEWKARLRLIGSTIGLNTQVL